VKTFSEIFGSLPAVRMQAPGRVNLLGEHTDYNDGLVLATAIAQRTRIEIAFNRGKLYRVYSVELDQLAEFSLDAPPRDHFATYVYGCVRELASYTADIPPFDLHVSTTIPIGAGLSSSAALEVATLRGLRELLTIAVDDVQIAHIAQRAENGYAGVNCGLLDQMASSLAQEGTLLFLDIRTLDRQLIPMPAAAELLIVHSGIERSLAHSAYNERRTECRQAARMMGLTSLRDANLASVELLPSPLRERARHVLTENARVNSAVGADAIAFGELMNASHQSLRDDYAVSVPRLDLLVSLLQAEPQVYGAKLTGAGFGGACVALCEPQRAQRIAANVLAAYADVGGRGRLLVPASG
jgi:galactokinase